MGLGRPRGLSALGVLAAVLACGLAASAAPAEPPRRLVWSEDFDGRRLDSSKWSITEDCWGGGNEERQCYTRDQVQIADGKLHLVARSQDIVGPAYPRDGKWPAGFTRMQHYASGKVETTGKAAFRYGRIEVRARFPTGQGLWSGIWLLPEQESYGAFPRSGEIDIAEAVNLTPTDAPRVYGSRHWGKDLKQVRTQTAERRLDDPAIFHTYGLEWTPTRMTWTVDGQPYMTGRTRRPFDKPFHLILNLAVGGRWPEQNGHGIDSSNLPAAMDVDWVRVYEP